MTLDIILSNPHKFYSVPEVAKALRISRQALHKHMDRGNIKYERIGHYKTIKGLWVRRYIEENKSDVRFRKSLGKILSVYQLLFERDE